MCAICYDSPRKLVQVEAPREGTGGIIIKRHEKTFGVMDIFTIFTVVMVSGVYNRSKLKLYFKYAPLTVCQLHFNKAGLLFF